MSSLEWVARLEHSVRPLLLKLPSRWILRQYSHNRSTFSARFAQEQPKLYSPPISEKRVLWGIPFQSGLMNAAGMFKNGEGYQVCAAQGAGGWLAGTTTAHPRAGNQKLGITHPFAPYPRSGAASNWLGLPNIGHKEMARILSSLEVKEGCPIGVSLSIDPSSSGQEALDELIQGMRTYQEAGVQFVEFNESCPNTEHSVNMQEDGIKALIQRLEYISQHFLQSRQGTFPVIVKLSNDLPPAQLTHLVPALLRLKFDGLNLGNTSIQYEKHAKDIHSQDQANYRFFTSNFGGGLSGRPLKEKSYNLCKTAMEIIREHTSEREFHIIRTGGIESFQDLKESEKIGVSLCQWYTGYFDAFGTHGHQVYQELFSHRETSNDS